MYRLIKVFGFVLLAFSALTTLGQKDQIRFEHLTRANGLSQSTVYAITQDKFGFIWIGTADGLNRYDGYNLKKYYFDSQNPKSISNNRIYNLLVDRDGVLWIATLGGGLCQYQYETDDFIAYKNNPDNPNSISGDVVMSIFEDEQGYLWVGTAETGLNRFDKKSKIFKRYLYDPNNPEGIGFKTIIAIDTDQNGNYWLAFNEAGIDMYNPKDGSFKHFKYDQNNPNSILSNRTTHVLCDSRGMVWIGTDKGLNIINPNTFEIKALVKSSSPGSLRSNEIYKIIEDKDSNIWVGGYGGLSYLDKNNIESLHFTNFYHSPHRPTSLSDDLVRSIYQDRSGIIWIGNYSKGVDWFLPGNNKFLTYQNEADNNKSLSFNIIRSIKEDKTGTIWVGTFGGGLNRFNPVTEEFMEVNDYQTLDKLYNQAFINVIAVDNKSCLWIGTWGGGLIYFNPITKATTHFKSNPNNPNGLSYDLIRSILIDKKGMVWIATSGGGLNLYNPATRKFTHYFSNKEDSTTISDNRIMGLCEDHKGNIWVGSSNQGLNKLDIKTNKFTRFKHNADNPKSLSSDRVYYIYESKDTSTLWICTGNGLNRFNLNDNTFEVYNKKSGFRNDVILNVVEDNSGYFWVSTMDGLCQFDPKDGKVIKIFDESDGLQSNEFGEGACLKDHNGNLYFGGNNGFSVFNPKSITDNKIVPSVYIVDFQVFNKSLPIDNNSILKNNIIVTKELNLDFTDYVFSFEFSALNFIHSEKNQYQYMMEGFDKDWILTDSKRRFVTYTNLPPDEYVFRVKASNNDGTWNQEGTSISILINPPYWQTWWFRITMFLILVSGLISFYFWRINSLNQQRKKLEELVKEKTLEVVLQKEELEDVNKELTDSNEELQNQRHELEMALQSLKDAQIQVLQSEKMASLGVLAAGVAHEINNPLNYIQGGIDAMDSYFKQHLKEHLDELTPLVNVIQLGVNRTSEIVKSLSHYSRSNDSSFVECDIHPIIDNCLIILHNEIKNRIVVKKKYTTEKYTLLGNEGKLHQVFLNIFHNASHAIANNGVISVTTYLSGSFLVIEIADSGCGISDEIIHKIMDPFFTTKEPGKGTGLGLTITYNIIQEHNGTITCESELDKGSKFVIRLPIKWVK